MDGELFRIGDIATRTGVSVDTVRYYESRGLLDGIVVAANGQRRFPPAAIDRIHVIRRAAAIGFSLDELVRIFRRRASGQAPCGHVLDSAKHKLAELDQRIEEMQSLRSTLERVIASWEIRFRGAPPGGLAFLLESLIQERDGGSY